MKKKIQFLLHNTGVFSYYCGYEYFIRSVELAVQNPERLQSIRKEIYIPVASEYHTDIRNVERDIRTIRDVMMKNGGAALLKSMTGSRFWIRKTPYPKDLITIFCDYLLQKGF